MTKLTNLLTQLVGINSVYPKEHSLAKWLCNFFARRGYEVVRQKVLLNRENLLIEKGRGQKSILLYAHMDTVGVTNGWKTDPFKLSIKGDSLYGLGAWDMKGGLAVNISTFLSYQPKNFKLKLALCVDEENISHGGYALSKSDFVNDVCCVIVTEPSFKYGNKGIVIGRIGRAVYRVHVKSNPTHVAFYKQQVDTNLAVGEILVSLRKLYKEAGKEKKQFLFARKISSQAIGMSTPQETTMEIEASVIPPYNNKQILGKLRKMIRQIVKKYQKIKCDVQFINRDTPFLNSYEIGSRNLFLQSLKQAVKTATIKAGRQYFRSSAADENIFASRGLTVLGIGPEGGNAHAPNEWVSLSSLEKLYNILNNFLAKCDN